MAALESYGDGLSRSPPNMWVTKMLSSLLSHQTAQGSSVHPSESRKGYFGSPWDGESLARWWTRDPAGVTLLYQHGGRWLPACASPILFKMSEQRRPLLASECCLRSEWLPLSAPAGTRWSCGSLRPRHELASAVTCGGAKVTAPNPKATQHNLSPSHKNHTKCRTR